MTSSCKRHLTYKHDPFGTAVVFILWCPATWLVSRHDTHIESQFLVDHHHWNWRVKCRNIVTWLWTRYVWLRSKPWWNSAGRRIGGIYFRSLMNKIYAAILTWAFYQIRKNVGCACASHAGNVFPAIDFKVNRYLEIPACITARASRTCRAACRDR